ncbi:MAG: hypothetical protein J5I50_13085 [Chitinophagaceae bacterium]|nr:hypothetical protein [Chitinophagaceae bacterium]
MTRNEKIAAVIIGAISAWAVYKIISMPDDERTELFDKVKKIISEALDNPDGTSDKINALLSDFDNNEDEDWIDRLYALRKMIKELQKG